jgi:ribonucleoside-triphosphate reductase
MSLRALMDYTFTAKYSRYQKDKNRRETWKEANDRVREMMLTMYSDKPDVHSYITSAYEAMYKKRVLGSQRALQFGGEPIFKHHARIYNCVASYCDRLRFFQECMYLLLCGCGAGFSVQSHHIAKLPPLNSIAPSGHKKFVIEDTIESWSDAVGVLISSYFDQTDLFPEHNGKVVQFDYSKIRPKGAPLSNGGKAPGPEPLRKALKNIKKILDAAVERSEFDASEFRVLKPIEAYDIVMHFADAVISGGVRRSATICVFSPDDEEMAKAKTGNWFIDNPQRGRSNNSALLLRNKTSKEDFSNLMKSVKEFGEPGFVWSDSTELIVNPCVEIGMYPVDVTTGLSGWQGCNLSTINCSKINKEQDFYEACEAAAIIGTLQAGFTKFPYLGEVSERIFARESLLGVSGTGWLETPEICLNAEVQKRGAEIVKETNRKIAEIIGIRAAARTTCVKPEGSSSCVLGTASGIHPHHAKRYIRRVQANKLENVYNFFKGRNPRACENSVWSANNSDDVISFCIEVPDGSKTKNQVCASSLLEIVKSTQQNWVMSGTNQELCTQPWLNHNVSNTINVKDDEWQAVEDFIYDNREYFCGISLLPATGDKDYPQAPFTTVYLPSEMLSHYGEGVMFVSGLIEGALNSWDNNLWSACSDALRYSAAFKLTPEITVDLQSREEIKLSQKQVEWILRCAKYASKYFEDDLKKLTYCMKDVYNYKLWTELKREYQDVDYTDLIESEDNTELEQSLACSGGACEIV